MTTKRTLKLRPYQLPAAEFAMNNDLSVIGMAPNGGKTEVATDVIVQCLENPNIRALVLAHSTDVLRQNFYDRLSEFKLPFKVSCTFEPDARVHVSLPHSEHLIHGKYDLVIVDEAHENYLEKRVQRIIEKVQPKKQVLLTGTPAKFVKRSEYKNKIYVLAANEIPNEYFAKLAIEIVVSKYNWVKELNNDYEVNTTYKFKRKDTEATMESVVLKLMQRFESGWTAEEFNSVDYDETTLKKITGKVKRGISKWGPIFSKIKKTIIVCRSIEQADDVGKIMNKHKVSYAVSHSECDPKSRRVVEFKNNKHKVLVVVDRGRLGYSDIDLYNIIDMSGTHNPNMIYQLLARVLRGDPNMQKFYMKVTTNENGMPDFTKACVCAALMLTAHEYLKTFNGSNFRGLMIPVLKKHNRRNREESPKLGPKPIKKTFVYPEFTHDVIDLFRDITVNLGKGPASIYKLVTMTEVRQNLSGRITYTEEDIFASARGEINLTTLLD